MCCIAQQITFLKGVAGGLCHGCPTWEWSVDTTQLAGQPLPAVCTSNHGRFDVGAWHNACHVLRYMLHDMLVHMMQDK